MRYTLKMAMIAFLALLCQNPAFAQMGSGFVSYFAKLAVAANGPSVQYNAQTQLATLSFPDSNMTNIAAKYQFRQFQQAFPNSSQQALRDVFLIEVNSANFFDDMNQFADVLIDVDTAKFSTYLLTINDVSYVPTVTYANWQAHLQFAQQQVQDIANDYTFRQFERAYPASIDPQYENVYLVEVNDPNFGITLASSLGGVFLTGDALVPQSYYLSITDPTHIPQASAALGGSSFAYLRPISLSFTNPTFTAIASTQIVNSLYQAFPNSNLEHLRNLYAVTTTSPQLLEQLKLSDSSIFPGYVDCPEPRPLINEPDDYGVFFPENNFKDQKELDLINAKAAWNLFPQGQVGDPNLKIAVNDGLPDVNHEDLQGKVIVLPHSAPYPDPSFETHGTPIAGVIAAATNNGKGISSIGYNLKVHASTKVSDTGMHELSLRHNMRLINASWVTGTRWPNCFYPGTFNGQIGSFSGHIVKQDIYNEIFENGTTCVFSAGNGNFLGVQDIICQSPNAYAFPASYDHNISVTSVGYYDPNANQSQANATGSFKNCHYTNCNTQSPSHHHNSRVDISAPGYWVKVLKDKKAGPEGYSKENGTSIAAPMVTGTLGLMLSKKPCLSPYQLEVLLKSSADASIYNLASNSAFAANKELGAGRLDAFAAVNAAQNLNCNDTNTKTMYIEGFTLNHRCPPGFASNGTNPKVKAIVRNSQGPLVFRWMPLDNAGNTCKMNNVTSADSNEVYEANNAPGSGKMLYYLVTASEVATSQYPHPRVASKRLKIHLKQANEQNRSWDLAMRDSWMDMITQPNNMDVVDRRDWDIWHSPDLWNRHDQDGILDHIDPEYSGTDSTHCVRNSNNRQK